MGLGMTPVFDLPDPAGEYGGDGKGLADAAAALDELAEKNGLTPLTHFVAHVEDDVEDFDADDEFLGEAIVAWHDAADGLHTVAGLLRALETDPSATARVADAGFLKDELHELERCLRSAVERRSRFRFETW